MSNLTIGGIIDVVREGLREISDDSVYPDRYIFRIILNLNIEQKVSNKNTGR